MPNMTAIKPRKRPATANTQREKRKRLSAALRTEEEPGDDAKREPTDEHELRVLS